MPLTIAQAVFTAGLHEGGAFLRLAPPTASLQLGVQVGLDHKRLLAFAALLLFNDLALDGAKKGEQKSSGRGMGGLHEDSVSEKRQTNFYILGLLF